MSDNPSDLPVQNGQCAGILDFSTEELIAELREEFTKRKPKEPQRLPGDMTKDDIIKATGFSRETVRLRMKDLVEDGKWQKLWVYEPDGKKVLVFRKVIS